MIPVIKPALEEGKTVEMTVTGQSMLPLLKDRVSSVKLVTPENLKKGDIVLFKKDEDHYVLHRILNVGDGAFDIVGDNQYVPDKDISKEDIIAKVAGYSRDGMTWKENDRLYRAMLPAIKITRRYGRGIKRRLKLLIKG